MLFFCFCPKFFHGLVENRFYGPGRNAQFFGDLRAFFILDMTHDDHLFTSFRQLVKDVSQLSFGIRRGIVVDDIFLFFFACLLFYLFVMQLMKGVGFEVA